MGYIVHKAIVVTTDVDWIGPIHAKAIKLCGDLVSPLIPSRVNGDATFVVAPDGSKRGWDASAEADSQRAAFIEYLSNCAGYPNWVEIHYGGDYETASIAESAWQ